MKLISANGPTKLQWSLPFISILLGFIFFLRNPSDLLATTQHGLLFVHCLFTGDMSQFIELGNTSTIMPTMYGFVLYAIFGLLLLPFVGVVAILPGGFDYTQMDQVWDATRYMQVCLALLLVLTSFLVFRLAKEMGFSEGKAKWSAYLYLASPFTLFADAVFWQYDVITLVFFIWAMIFYVRKDYTKFSILMAVAIACKLFAAFAFVPLILLVEKRLWHLAKYALIAFSLTAVSELVVRKLPGAETTQELRENLLVKLTDNGLVVGIGVISLAVVSVVGLCIYAYLTKIDDLKSLNYHAIYFSFISLALPFTFFHANPYWWILAIPFLAILIVGNARFKELLVIASGAFAFVIITAVIAFRFYMDQDMVNGGVFAQITGLRYSGTPSFVSLAESLDLDKPELFFSVAATALFALVILTAPWKDRKLELEVMPEVPGGAVWLYNGALYVFILPSLALFFKELIFG